MNSFETELQTRLEALRTQGLFRELRCMDSPQGTRIQVAGQMLLNFSSNDYLALANHPRLKAAATHAIERFGAGAGASRLICGSLALHHELEEALAAFKGTEAALSFSSGYATALGTICGLLGKGDVIVLDKLVHACLVDAARLSGASIRVFKHNDLNDLEDILEWAARKPATRNPLIVTEAVFSMDGDHAPLREIVELKERHGAWLMVDEAHAMGIYGQQGQGLANELGVADCIEIHLGTLGKALGVSGGYIAGSRTLVEYLVNRARSFIFSTAPAPAVAAAAAAAVQFLQTTEGDALRQRLWQNVELAAPRLVPRTSHRRSAIIPLIVGDETAAVELAARLCERGIFVPAIRYPAVARGQARLRVTLTAAHILQDLERLLDALADLKLETSNLQSL